MALQLALQLETTKDDLDDARQHEHEQDEEQELAPAPFGCCYTQCAWCTMVTSGPLAGQRMGTLLSGYSHEICPDCAAQVWAKWQREKEQGTHD